MRQCVGVVNDKHSTFKTFMGTYNDGHTVVCCNVTKIARSSAIA